MSLIDDYKTLLLGLLPRGRAWNRNTGTVMDEQLEGTAVELARIHQRGLDIIEEMDPRTTLELLDDWERVVQIPDDCQEKAGNVVQRRADVVRKLTLRGSQSKPFYVRLAAAFGYTVTIGSFVPFYAGRGRAGDRCYGTEYKFYFTVSADTFTTTIFRAGTSRCGDRLRDVRNDTLECVINRAKQAHTGVIFLYGS